MVLPKAEVEILESCLDRVVWRGAVRCGVVWCGVVRCAAVWCGGVVWCGVGGEERCCVVW